MSASAPDDLPEGFREALTERPGKGPEREAMGLIEEHARHPEPAGTTWLLVGILVAVAVGVLMLIIFASGGNADESMML
jgi:hypothetical protein